MIFDRQLNWLAIAAGNLVATLLLVSGAQAADSSWTTPSAANSTLTQQPAAQLIALRKKKRPKPKVRSRVKTKTTATAPTTPAVDLSQAPPPAPPTPVEPPKSIEVTPNSTSPSTTPTAPATPPTEAPKPATPAPAPFSLNTKLQGSVIFSAAGTFAGDYSRNAAFGHRTRLELKTEIGSGTLTTRLQAVGFGLSNQNPSPNTAAAATPEGSLSWTDGTTTSSIGIDALKYEFPLAPQTQLVVAANAGAADDFTDTINPYFDGDGASGSISLFGNRPSIYYTVQGTGVGIRHKLNDTTELSVGYLARNGNNPATGNGLLGGGYGALAQVSFKTGENSKVGVTYTRSFNSDPGTGSLNANLGGISNNIGVQGIFQVSPQLALGGWAGYTQNQATSGDRQIWNWAITAALPDVGGKGNLAGFLVGQEPRVASSGIDPVTGVNTTDTKAGLHIEGFYQIKVNDSISITPGIIYLTAPNQDANSSGAVIGAVRTTFTF
jgi:Carbohydrate-selective porin, OprB family